MKLYDLATGTFIPFLHTLETLLDKGAELARLRGFDPDFLFEAQLAPDMYPLAMQIRIATDMAKDAMALLSGREALLLGNDEKTHAEFKNRIRKTRDFIVSVPEQAFDGAEEKRFVVRLTDELVLDATGAQYLRDWALPHFYFHIVTAYDILRHNGAAIGKRDYLVQGGQYIRKR